MKSDALQVQKLPWIKAGLQSKGIRVPLELIDELETKWNAPSVRSGRLVLCLKSPENDQELIPVFIVNGKRSEESPYHLVKNGEHFEILEDGSYYSDAFFIPHPKFYDRFTSNGTPMHKFAVIVGPGHARSVVNQKCFYQQIGQPCKFCAVQRWWDSNIEKTPLQIAETIEAGVKEGVIAHVSLTTATTNADDKGLNNLVETARSINARVKIPIMIEFEPFANFALLDYLLKEAKKAGVTTVSCNIECFDDAVRGEVMPAKGKNPVSMYIATWEKCLDILGKDNVFTVAIVGIGEDDDSFVSGAEMAASHGILTFIVPHSPAVGALFENMEPPSPERMVSLYKQAIDIYQKYGLDICASQAGCVRGGGFSAIKDVAVFGI